MLGEAAVDVPTVESEGFDLRITVAVAVRDFRKKVVVRQNVVVEHAGELVPVRGNKIEALRLAVETVGAAARTNSRSVDIVDDEVRSCATGGIGQPDNAAFGEAAERRALLLENADGSDQTVDCLPRARSCVCNAVVIVSDAEDCVSLVFGKVRAHRRRCNVVVLLRVSFVGAGLNLRGDAFKPFLQQDVDDAGDGVRSINRRRSAREHVDSLDHLRRNGVEIDVLAERNARNDSAPVDQDENAVGP